ncbi:hypothetical protein KP509_1Z129700 [Ceratopteris richardii]|nr:hypothetical protein KP509_1Z129700 [Ceratopteris richardii]
MNWSVISVVNWRMISLVNAGGGGSSVCRFYVTKEKGRISALRRECLSIGKITHAAERASNVTARALEMRKEWGSLRPTEHVIYLRTCVPRSSRFLKLGAQLNMERITE